MQIVLAIFFITAAFILGIVDYFVEDTRLKKIRSRKGIEDYMTSYLIVDQKGLG